MANFEYIPISGEQKTELARVLANSIRDRIRRGHDVNDQPAPPLSQKYARRKIRLGRQPIRDWTLTGTTMRALGPVTMSDGRFAVGFNDARAAKIAALNNSRSQQFGMSPANRRDFLNALDRVKGSLIRWAA